MRPNAHSLRLAVSLLLGAMFMVLPMASTASAAASTSLLTSSPIPTNIKNNPCILTLQDSFRNAYANLTPARFERVETIADALVITQPHDELARSFTPSQTIVKKAESDDPPQTVEVTPLPLSTSIPVSEMPQNVQATTPAPSSTGPALNADVLFNLVNSYRAQVGLPPFERNDQICAVAASRAPELDTEIYVTHSMHAGFHARNLPFWATENMISMRTEQEALTWWLNSPVHRSAILGNYQYACVACGGKSCAMIFSNLAPKVVPLSEVIQATPTPGMN